MSRLPPSAATPSVSNDGGVTFEDLLRYVMKHLRMTETKATFRIMQVLRSGMALKRIQKTLTGRYRLVQPKPPGLACKIKEMRTSDDENSSACSTNSD